MALFALSYQLNKDKDYQKLWDELERLGAHKVMRSFWFLDLTVDEPDQVKQHLMDFIDADDQLAVVPMPLKPAVYRGYTGTIAWLDSHF